MLAEDARGNQLLEFTRLDERALSSIDPLTHAVVSARDGDDRVLFVFSRRRRWWELAGGAIDPGETPRECAVRELREESGMTCVPNALRFVGALKIQVHDRRSHAERRVEYGALYALAATAPVVAPFVPNDEIGDVCWWNGTDDIGAIGAIDRKLMELAWHAG